MDIKYALQIARKLYPMLAPHVERIELVGSYKRQDKDFVKDVEFLVIQRPGHPTPEFGEKDPPATFLDKGIRQMDRDGYFMHSFEDMNGERKISRKLNLMLLGYVQEDFPLEIFITTREKWGIMNVIRTGPSDFSHCYVTPEGRITSDGNQGLMPQCFTYNKGTSISFRGSVLSLPEEQDAIELLGWDWIPPQDRRKYVKPKGAKLPPRNLPERYVERLEK